MEKLKIIKIGGKITDNEPELQQALKIFADIPSPKILVHGGGSAASAFLEKLGIRPKLIGGRRITDAESLKVVQMVYAGLINKNIVAKLQAINCPAIGLSGADIDAIRANKRPVQGIDYGFVGDVSRVNATAISQLIESGFVPVFCALTHDGKGQMLNTNADTVAAELAVGLSGLYQTDIHFCFEKKGVLKDSNDLSSVISNINLENYEQLKNEKVIADGMLPKIDNAFQALKKGVCNVYISHYSTLMVLNSTGKIKGTKITLQKNEQ